MTDDNDTIAYTHPSPPNWRETGENLINHIRDAYDALWDWMPAIAALTTALWLVAHH